MALRQVGDDGGELEDARDSAWSTSHISLARFARRGGVRCRPTRPEEETDQGPEDRIRNTDFEHVPVAYSVRHQPVWHEQAGQPREDGNISAMDKDVALRPKVKPLRRPSTKIT